MCVGAFVAPWTHLPVHGVHTHELTVDQANVTGDARIRVHSMYDD